MANLNETRKQLAEAEEAVASLGMHREQLLERITELRRTVLATHDSQP